MHTSTKITTNNMLSIDTLGVSIDMGTIPIVNKLNAKITSFGIMADYGVVPPKNFFKGGISVVGVSGEVMEESERTSILFYQIY